MWTRNQRSNSPKRWISVQRQLVPKVKGRDGDKRQQTGVDCLKTLNCDLILESQCVSEGSDAPSELQAVERIALRGHQICTLEEEAILSCVRLRICNLSRCYIQDIKAFYGSVNLLKLDLSDNEVSWYCSRDNSFACHKHKHRYITLPPILPSLQISELPPVEFWLSLVSLQVLYLDGNLLNDRRILHEINGCPRLHILTLYNTPLSLTRGYRHRVVNRYI